MKYVMVDVEADGPIPGDFSMVSFAAVIVEPGLGRHFSARLHPISERFIPEALAVSGHTREETLSFESPGVAMQRFAVWLSENAGPQPRFVSDNNGYDWMFVCWYFFHFAGSNPFGYTSVNMGSLYKGLVKDMQQNFKHLRVTKHSHDPLDDVMGNAEALLHMVEAMGLKGI